jgi:hypothetical protein
MPRKGTRKPSEILRDLRHVYRRPATEDQSPGQKKLREIWEADSTKFLDMLHKAEQAHRAGADRAKAMVKTSGGAPGAVAEPEADEGSARVEELIESILKEAKEAGVLNDERH